VDQIKIGSFIKELRKEKGLTQEQLAEQLSVNRRTVSRWETGNNLPDLDILIEMADYYQIGLRELLDGEKRMDGHDSELEETARKVAEYSSEDKQKVFRQMHPLFIAGAIASVLNTYLLFSDCADNFLGGLCHGITLGMMIVGVIITSKFESKIRMAKRKWLKK